LKQLIWYEDNSHWIIFIQTTPTEDNRLPGQLPTGQLPSKTAAT